MAGIQQGPPPEHGIADEIWKQSLTESYKDELAAWHRSSGWGRAKIMATEDRRGTGDLFSEALRNYTPTGTGAGLPQVGGVSRLLSQLTGGNVNG